MAKRLIVLDYNAVRKAFDEEFKATRKLIESGETHLDNLAEGFTEADRVLRKLPAVDAVEVVRCAQCKYFGQDGSGYYDDEFYCINPSGLDDIVKQSDFCSYGERKEG